MTSRAACHRGAGRRTDRGCDTKLTVRPCREGGSVARDELGRLSARAFSRRWITTTQNLHRMFASPGAAARAPRPASAPALEPGFVFMIAVFPPRAQVGLSATNRLVGLSEGLRQNGGCSWDVLFEEPARHARTVPKQAVRRRLRHGAQNLVLVVTWSIASSPRGFCLAVKMGADVGNLEAKAR